MPNVQNGKSNLNSGNHLCCYRSMLSGQGIYYPKLNGDWKRRLLILILRQKVEIEIVPSKHGNP